MLLIIRLGGYTTTGYTTSIYPTTLNLRPWRPQLHPCGIPFVIILFVETCSAVHATDSSRPMATLQRHHTGATGRQPQLRNGYCRSAAISIDGSMKRFDHRLRRTTHLDGAAVHQSGGSHLAFSFWNEQCDP